MPTDHVFERSFERGHVQLPAQPQPQHHVVGRRGVAEPRQEPQAPLRERQRDVLSNRRCRGRRGAVVRHAHVPQQPGQLHLARSDLVAHGSGDVALQRDPIPPECDTRIERPQSGQQVHERLEGHARRVMVAGLVARVCAGLPRRDIALGVLGASRRLLVLEDRAGPAAHVLAATCGATRCSAATPSAHARV